MYYLNFDYVLLYVKYVHLNAKITKDMHSRLCNPNLHRGVSVVRITKPEILRHKILLYGPHYTESLCGPQHPGTSINKCSSVFSIISSKTHKHTKETMQNFVNKLKIFLTWSQTNSSLFDRVMKIFSMLSKIQTNTPKKQWIFLPLSWWSI